MILIFRRPERDAASRDADLQAADELGGYVGEALAWVILLTVAAPVTIWGVMRRLGISQVVAIGTALAAYVVALWGLTNGFLWQTVGLAAMTATFTLMFGSIMDNRRKKSDSQGTAGPKWHFS